jgi:hypothetical protein
VATRKKSALAASITSVFSPPRTTPSLFDSASIANRFGSAGAPASTSAGVPRSSPAASGVSQRSFCSSEPAKASARPATVFESNGEGAQT